MSWRGAMLGSLVEALGQPAWWVLSLAAFLIRGGLLVFILPIVILPTPAGLLNAFGAEITGFAFGSPSGAFISAVVVATIAVTAWLLVGGLVAAWADVGLVAAVAERLGRPVPGWTRYAWRALAIRLATLVPLAIATAWGVARIVDAVWAEYLHPGDLATPLFLRIALRIPDVIAAIGLTWLAGEAAGGLAVRHLVVAGRPTGEALARGWLDLLVRPSVVATLAATTVAWLAVALPVARAAGDAWDRLRGLLAGSGDPTRLLLTLVLFAAVWLGGVVVVGVVGAWRSAAWTLEVVRREPLRPPAAIQSTATAPRAVAVSPAETAPEPYPDGGLPAEAPTGPAMSALAARHGGGGEAV